MLILVGCNHRSAPIALRERMAFSDDALPAALGRLLARDGIHEALILSTCNRVEILARSEGDVRQGVERVKRFLCDERSIGLEQLDLHGYHFADREAVRHVFEVACGLDSMILGEPQILGQVKRAYRIAKDVGATGSMLDRLMQHCLAGAKRLRTETGLSRNAVSVASAAVNLARQIFGDLRGRKALLIGAGKMTAMVARHLLSQGMSEMLVTSRTYNQAVSFSERFRARPVRWEEGLSRLGEVDVVVSGTGSHRPVVGRTEVVSALRARRGQPLFLIDIAVPRDIDPEVHLLDNAYLYDIDALQNVVDANLDGRHRAAQAARHEIVGEVEAFDRWRQSLQVQPTIVALRESVLRLGDMEIERFRRRLGPLSAEQEEGIREMTRALLHKILHRPVVHLRNSVERGDIDASAALVRQIFGLDSTQAEALAGQAPASDESDDDEEPGEPSSPGPTHLLRGGKDT